MEERVVKVTSDGTRLVSDTRRDEIFKFKIWQIVNFFKQTLRRCKRFNSESDIPEKNNQSMTYSQNVQLKI